jgi:hypothetical protein
MVVKYVPYAQIYTPTPPLVPVVFDFYQVQAAAAVALACGALLLLMLFWDRYELAVSRKNALAESRKPRTPSTFFASIFPPELQDGRWYRLYWGRLQVEHSWLCLLLPYKSTRDFRALKLALVFSNLLTFLFLNTGLAGLFYRDDGSCEKILYRNECVSRQAELATVAIRSSCTWHDVNDSCSFREPPFDPSQFITLLAYALVVTVLSIPLTKMMEMLTRAVMERKEKVVNAHLPWNSLSMMQKVLPGSDGLEEFHRRENKMATAQDVRSKVLKAARLRKIQEATDLLLPIEEAERLQKVGDNPHSANICGCR